MPSISEQKCTPCKGNSPPVTPEEIDTLKPQIPNWSIVDRDGTSRLERVYKFLDFKQALAFTQAIGEEAEKEGHHPALLTEWGKVTVTWWTHAIEGLHRNDFIMAAKTDQIKAQQFSN
ncbi:MAG TPA: 4a-hydroxytetrahydrobiopterin dehydratase [Elainellaceae cyanobacterium]